jgi:hypothetical protein
MYHLVECIRVAFPQCCSDDFVINLSKLREHFVLQQISNCILLAPFWTRFSADFEDENT